MRLCRDRVTAYLKPGSRIPDAGFAVLELFITSDVRPDRQKEKWVNVIGGKEAC